MPSLVGSGLLVLLGVWVGESLRLSQCWGEEGGRVLPYDSLYQDGIQAYYANDWHGVVRCMEAALSSQAELRATKAGCALRCAESPTPEPGLGLGLGMVALRRARCLRECEAERLGAASLYRTSDEVHQDFNKRIPYNYLQLAYYMLNQLDRAAEAAHTFFVANPEHVEMGQSLEQYRQLSGVQPAHFINREARPHMEAFMVAMMDYDADRYAAAIEGFERALELYWVSEAECRALCQGPQRMDSYGYLEYSSHLYEIIADHYGQVLRCQHECGRDLATRPGRLSPIDNYLPSHLDFLQYSYYQVGDHIQALAAVHSYLLFNPGDEAMEENLEFYSSQRSESDPPTSPRADVLRYLERYEAEKQLLISHSQGLGTSYIDPNHWISPVSQNQENPSVNRPGSEEGVVEARNSLDGRKRPVEKHESFKEGGPLLYSHIQLVSDSQGMNGSQRVLLDNVLTPQECGHLYSMASVITMAGDGYRGKTSPHTPNERFEGATVLKALMYGYEGRIPLLGARLFYDASEKVRRIVQSYFMLNSTLYFSYTHLVCRSAIAGQQNNRNDLSHPIHADNCLLDPDANECWKEAPAYTYRDYSAILYLNGDFDGGEFIFTESDAKTITASVKPQCGRMVSFSSGGENPHGVRAVTRGQRCAVALWFTLDPIFREVERLQADEVVQQMMREHGVDEELSINPRDEL